MGAQASKVSRKLPTQARPETLQNVPKDSPATLEAAILAASESKTEFIEEDGRDPHLHANLQSLGPVTIPPTITKMRQSDTMLNIIQQRKQEEQREIKGLVVSDGLLSIDSLFTLLEQRKRLNPGEIDKPDVRQAILEKYKLDEPTLSTLLKYYNTMAIMPPALDDKEERRLGIWVNDKLDWESSVKAVDQRNAQIKKAKQQALKDNNRNGEDQEAKKDQALKDLFDENY